MPRDGRVLSNRLVGGYPVPFIGYIRVVDIPKWRGICRLRGAKESSVLSLLRKKLLIEFLTLSLLVTFNSVFK